MSITEAGETGLELDAGNQTRGVKGQASAMGHGN